MSAECYAERTQTARKEYRCCECLRIIARGAPYERASGLWDGEWMRFKTCSPCADLRKQVRASLSAYDQEELYFETLGEWCSQYDITHPFYVAWKAIKGDPFYVAWKAIEGDPFYVAWKAIKGGKQ